MSRKQFNIEKFVSYDEFTKKSKCLIETCQKELCGKIKSNIKRHYKLVHKQEIMSDESDSDDVPVCKKIKNTAKLSTTIDKHEFIKCCVGLVTKKNVPFRIFDDQECFKPLIAPYEQKFNINLNSSNIDSILEETCSHIKSQITALVKEKMVCLKLDICSQMERNVIGINIQYIKDYKICINTIGMIQTTKRHTATYLKEEILKCLEEYDIGINQIYSNTTDNGANILKLSKLLREMQNENLENEVLDNDANRSNQIESHVSTVFSIVPCAAHTVQLAAYDVLKTLDSEIEHCRIVAKKLRTSIRSEDDDISLPCLDVITNWNSTFNMITKILSFKEYIENFDSLNNIHVNWIFIENFVNAFTPLSKCILKLQNEQYLLGDFFRDWLMCELELEELVSTNTYALSLLDAMRKRKETLLKHDAFAAAIYLDPRFNFKASPFLTDERKQSAMNHLFKAFEMMKKCTDNTNEQESIQSNLSSISSQEDISTSTSNAYYKLDLHVRTLLNTQNLSSPGYAASVKQKLIRICEGERVQFGTNILDYWRKSCGGDKDMTQLIETALAVPATQASVERSFSALFTILTELSSEFYKNSLSNLLITKLNYDLLDFSNFDVDNIISNAFPLENV